MSDKPGARQPKWRNKLAASDDGVAVDFGLQMGMQMQTMTTIKEGEINPPEDKPQEEPKKPPNKKKDKGADSLSNSLASSALMSTDFSNSVALAQKLDNTLQTVEDLIVENEEICSQRDKLMEQLDGSLEAIEQLIQQNEDLEEETGTMKEAAGAAKVQQDESINALKAMESELKAALTSLEETRLKADNLQLEVKAKTEEVAAIRDQLTRETLGITALSATNEELDEELGRIKLESKQHAEANQLAMKSVLDHLARAQALLRARPQSILGAKFSIEPFDSSQVGIQPVELPGSAREENLAFAQTWYHLDEHETLPELPPCPTLPLSASPRLLPGPELPSSPEIEGLEAFVEMAKLRIDELEKESFCKIEELENHHAIKLAALEEEWKLRLEVEKYTIRKEHEQQMREVHSIHGEAMHAETETHLNVVAAYEKVMDELREDLYAARDQIDDLELKVIAKPLPSAAEDTPTDAPDSIKNWWVDTFTDLVKEQELESFFWYSSANFLRLPATCTDNLPALEEEYQLLAKDTENIRQFRKKRTKKIIEANRTISEDSGQSSWLSDMAISLERLATTQTEWAQRLFDTKKEEIRLRETNSSLQTQRMQTLQPSSPKGEAEKNTTCLRRSSTPSDTVIFLIWIGAKADSILIQLLPDPPKDLELQFLYELLIEKMEIPKTRPVIDPSIIVCNQNYAVVISDYIEGEAAVSKIDQSDLLDQLVLVAERTCKAAIEQVPGTVCRLILTSVGPDPAPYSDFYSKVKATSAELVLNNVSMIAVYAQELIPGELQMHIIPDLSRPWEYNDDVDSILPYLGLQKDSDGEPSDDDDTIQDPRAEV